MDCFRDIVVGTVIFTVQPQGTDKWKDISYGSYTAKWDQQLNRL